MALSDIDQTALRLRVLLVLMLAAFGLLAGALWFMQVARGHRYQSDQVRQSVRRVRVPGLRGLIYDRNMNSLAENRPSYCVAIYLEELRQPGAWKRTIDKVDGLLDGLARQLGLPRQLTREDIQTHIRKRLPMPLLAWRDLDERALARLSERGVTLPGVDIYLEPVREYPQSNATSHVVGYVGRAEPPREEEPSDYYLPEMTGRVGIEKQYDGLLKGEAGGRLFRVDVSGYRHDDVGGRAAKKGCDLLMTLDLRAQRLAREALEGRVGAVAVVDPSNGDVLALVSSPDFDPNAFIPSIPAQEWKLLVDDPQHPMLSRAVAGTFAPGSTFKPIVALASLEKGSATANTSYECPGYYMLGAKRFGCWQTSGHGRVNLREAIQHSCNVYFFNLGLRCGPEAIQQMAAGFGFGRKTEVDLDYEAAGILPTDAWKRQHFNDGWRDGDTCNMSIGQGALAVTPLQMAVAAAALANGGAVYKPRLVKGIRPGGEEQFRAMPVKLVSRINCAAGSMKIVREGMRDVVMTEGGSGKLAAVHGVAMAGKTGTAEHGVKGQGHKYGWMILFAPYEQPKYAVAMVVEEAETGGRTVAPRMHIIMQGLVGKDDAKEGAG